MCSLIFTTDALSTRGPFAMCVGHRMCPSPFVSITMRSCHHACLSGSNSSSSQTATTREASKS
jgi:hypothetical protein